jgi:class 3 adenylate cyclase/tetratricopeptide (TPR) repeat protein
LGFSIRSRLAVKLDKPALAGSTCDPLPGEATMDVTEWLWSLGLAQYAPAFEQNHIGPELLSELTADDLKDLGIASVGHRRAILAAIAGLRARPAVAADVSVPDPAAGSAAERRQLTVMFCDLVGSTALAARLDPEELREVIGAYHRCVAAAVRRFDGLVAKYMGDGVLVYFGYPRAHEDDAERAVRAGLDTVVAVGVLDAPAIPGTPALGERSGDRLQVRIGIATGLVVVGDLIGEGEAQERGVVGETPNLAARLQALAEPGSVMIAPATRRLIGDRFRLQALGRHEVKGLAEPVEAWAVAGVSASEGRFEAVRSGGLTGFVGRDYELGLLIDRWNLAQDGEGQVVLLSGEPGIGKSRIVSELRGRLEAQHATSLRLHCSPYFVNSAFYPIIDNLERALRFARDDTAERKLDKLEALIVGQYGRPREDLRFIAAMLSIPCDERFGAIAMTPQKFKDETLRALADTTQAIARRQPTVLLFEDIHWADPTTLEVIDLLIHRVRNVPLLVVITHRPEFSSRWSHYGHVTALALAKLTRPQSSAMVSRLAGGKAMPADLVEQILGKTDGVPLFVEELTKSILESAGLRDAGDRWEYAGRARTLTIPLTLRDSLMARLDRFTPVKEIAQIGAAIGREFGYELIAAVAPHPKPELDWALAQLVGSGLALREGTPPAAVYTFKHALVQDAAYDSLLKARRQELHGKIARVVEERLPNTEATEPELLAHHYTEAKLLPKAIQLFQKAASLALRRMALTEAIAHLDKGLELVAALPPSAERDGSELDLRTLLGTAWIALRGWQAQEVWDSLQPALGLADALRRNDALVPILWGLFIHVLCRGRVAESLRWITQLMNAAETYRDADLLIVGRIAAAAAYFWLGAPIKAREHADRVLALYSGDRHGHLVGILNQDPKTVSLVFSALSTWMLGYPEQAARIIDSADDHARRRGHPFDLGWALTIGANLFDYLREPDEFLKRIDEADRLGRENSLPFLTQDRAPSSTGLALIRKGQVAEGIALLEKGLAVWEQSGGRARMPDRKSVLAEGLAQLGDLGGALALIDQVIAQIERAGWEERHYYAEALRIKGWLLAGKGDLAGAERCYTASLDWARTQRAKSWELRTATSYARLMHDQGRAGEAYEVLAPVYGWFTEGFATKDLKDAKALLEELETAGALAPAPPV